MRKIKPLFEIFFSMLKIGLFTFGGGYAMIHLLDDTFVLRKKWISEEEFLDLVTVAESTPGPIAINCSTYIGYKKMGFLGAVFATLGMCLPSFGIIYLISLFFDRFLEIKAVASAFRGIQACVVFLILFAGIKMLKKIKKNTFNLFVISIVFVSFVIFSLLSVRFSSIFYVLIFGFLGFFLFAIRCINSKKRKGGNEK